MNCNEVLQQKYVTPGHCRNKEKKLQQRKSKSLLALNQPLELEDLTKDKPLSGSDDEEDSDDERKHQKFLEAISALDGKKRPNLAERSEASLTVSEFNVNSKGTGEKLVLSDLLEPIKTSSLASVKKQLNRVKAKKTVELPLSKQEVQRIHREVAFNQTSKTLSKWDPIVLKNRKAEQLIFPQNKEPMGFAPIEHVVSGWKARTPLEQEVFNVLNKNKLPMTDPLLTPKEKASLKAMSLEEVKMRRAELQRARALQSYYEARARREKKIKSKKYHKLLKKEKVKTTLKEFEMLQKVDPGAALEELEKIEKARMMERMSLKHQNSGKWAKSKAIMAKYDLEARQAMQEQLAKNKELTQKLQVASEGEEEVEEGKMEEDGELLVPDAVNEVQMNGTGPNPWMLKRVPGASAAEKDIQNSPEPLTEPAVQEASESEEETPVTEEEMMLQECAERRLLRKKTELSHGAVLVGSGATKDSSSQEVLSELRALSRKLNKGKQHSKKKPKECSTKATEPAEREEPAEEEEEPLLVQRPERAQTMEEIEKLGHEESLQSKARPSPVSEKKGSPAKQPAGPKEKTKKEQMIDLQNLLTTKSPSVKSVAVPTMVEGMDDEDEEEQRAQREMTKEAFSGDDVIKEFLKEKREAMEASKPKDLDLTLPGWGEWGGVGLMPSAKKRRRFLIKAPEGPPRKDKNLPNVIINEKRNIHAASHQVQELPRPFTHHEQFERTIQTPIGSTWNTQRTFQKLTTPKVVTRPGHIIKPIKAEDVGYRSSSRSDLSVVEKNPQRLTLRRKKQLQKKSTME